MSAVIAPGQKLGGVPVTEARAVRSRRTGGGRRRLTTWLLSVLSIVLFALFAFPVY